MTTTKPKKWLVHYVHPDADGVDTLGSIVVTACRWAILSEGLVFRDEHGTDVAAVNSWVSVVEMPEATK